MDRGFPWGGRWASGPGAIALEKMTDGKVPGFGKSRGRSSPLNLGAVMIRDAPAPPAMPQTKYRTHAVGTAFLARPMRLLVVEDEPDLLAGLARALRKQGYAVDTAADGAEGLHAALGIDYDVVVLDVMLPRMDGWEVLARLRQAKATPVLMLTARDRSADRVRGLDAGADDYLVKPFDLSELFARLRALIRRGSGQAHSVVNLGDVQIDTAARRVTRAGVEVSLTAREFVLLEYLALHRGEVVTRTALYEHLYDESDATLSNILDVHVSNLRKNLGQDVIATRRGHGYAIE